MGSQNERNNKECGGVGVETAPKGNRVSISLFQTSNKPGEEAQGQGQNSNCVYVWKNCLLIVAATWVHMLLAYLGDLDQQYRCSKKYPAEQLYVLYVIFSIINHDMPSAKIPFAIIILGRFFLPLQGDY